MARGLIGIIILTIALAFIAGCVIEELETMEEELVIEEPAIEETEAQTYTIYINEKNVNPKELTISLGDAITWQNNRSLGTRGVAEVTGVKGFSSFKTGQLLPGDTYSHTFNEPGKYEWVERYRFFPGIITVE